MSHLTSAWFTVLVFGFTCSDLSFLQKKLLLYIKKKEISDKPSFQHWALFPFYRGDKSDRKPHSWVVHFPVTIHHHCKQQTNPAKFFPVLFLPLARKHLEHRQISVSNFTLPFQRWVSARNQREKGIFGAGDVTGEASSAGNTEDLGRQKDISDGIIIIIPAVSWLNVP